MFRDIPDFGASFFIYGDKEKNILCVNRERYFMWKNETKKGDFYESVIRQRTFPFSVFPVKLGGNYAATAIIFRKRSVSGCAGRRKSSHLG